MFVILVFLEGRFRISLVLGLFLMAYFQNTIFMVLFFQTLFFLLVFLFFFVNYFIVNFYLILNKLAEVFCSSFLKFCPLPNQNQFF